MADPHCAPAEAPFLDPLLDPLGLEQDNVSILLPLPLRETTQRLVIWLLWETMSQGSSVCAVHLSASVWHKCWFVYIPTASLCMCRPFRHAAVFSEFYSLPCVLRYSSFWKNTAQFLLSSLKSHGFFTTAAQHPGQILNYAAHWPVVFSEIKLTGNFEEKGILNKAYLLSLAHSLENKLKHSPKHINTPRKA